jgi:hypothetical protein
MSMQALDRILSLTEIVEQHVERGEWAEAGEIDAERCRLLAELFTDPGATADLAPYRDVLQQLLIRNRQTIERVQECQQQLVRSSAALQRAGGAMRAYRKAAGSSNLVYLRDAMVNES